MKTVPSLFKPLTPFIRRAEELEKDTLKGESKLVAFYCRQFAMEMGIQLRENDESEEATSFLLQLMDQLEKDKAAMPVFTPEEGKQVCTLFAMEVFQKADDEDRSGMATKNTARSFYAAGTFFDILRQFGELEPDIKEKTKYAKFKATDILKAIKEGRTPTAGAPGEQAMPNEPTQPSTSPSIEIPAAPTKAPSLPPTPTVPDIPERKELQHPSAPEPMEYYSPPTEYVPPSKDRIAERTGKCSAGNMDDAMECAQFAIAALKTREVGLAVDRLEKALQYLR